MKICCIEESIKGLSEVASHLNERVRQHENSYKLLEINTWMGKYYHGNLVEPGRYFIKAETVLKVTFIVHNKYSLKLLPLN